MAACGRKDIRVLAGIILLLAIAYWIRRRSATTKLKRPVTTIVKAELEAPPPVKESSHENSVELWVGNRRQQKHPTGAYAELTGSGMSVHELAAFEYASEVPGDAVATEMSSEAPGDTVAPKKMAS